MKDLCIPIPGFGDDEFAEIKVQIGSGRIKYIYRVVSFPWDTEDERKKERDELEESLVRITRLKKEIEHYDKNWELIQIFNPPENAHQIQVLYRKKQNHK